MRGSLIGRPATGTCASEPSASASRSAPGQSVHFASTTRHRRADAQALAQARLPPHRRPAPSASRSTSTEGVDRDHRCAGTRRDSVGSPGSAPADRASSPSRGLGEAIELRSAPRAREIASSTLLRRMMPATIAAPTLSDGALAQAQRDRVPPWASVIWPRSATRTLPCCDTLREQRSMQRSIHTLRKSYSNQAIIVGYPPPPCHGRPPRATRAPATRRSSP